MASHLSDRGASRAALFTPLACIVLSLTLLAPAAFGESTSPRTGQSGPAPTTKPTLPTLLSSPDFWTTTGTQAPKPTPEEIGQLQRLAANDSSPAIRIRATKLLCDAEKHVVVSPEISTENAAAATAAAFTYIESHLNDPEIAKYSPQSGFTHVTVSKRADGSNDIWVLIESANHPDGFSGGLNLQFELKTGTITSCDRWGPIRPGAH